MANKHRYLCVPVAGIVTMIIVRTLRRDIAKYNQIEDEVSHLTRHCFQCLGADHVESSLDHNNGRRSHIVKDTSGLSSFPV